MTVALKPLTTPDASAAGAKAFAAAPTHLSDADLVPELRDEDPRKVAPADAKVLSYALFDRLAALDEGTYEFSYVRATLIELNMSLVAYVAGRFRGSSEPMEDIVQVGTIGLIKAIDRFDAGRGVEFTTFAVPTIVGEIRRFFRDATWAVHVPRRLQELRLALAKTREALEQDLGREPTVRELSRRLDVPEEEIIEGLTASNGYTAGSLDLGEDDDNESPLHGRIGCDDPEFDKIEHIHVLKPLIAKMEPRDRMILSLRFCDDLTQSEIGERLGISQMHVSRLLTRALTTLRAGLNADADAVR